MQHTAIALNSMVYYTNVTQFYGYITHKCHSTQFNSILYTKVTQFDGILHINVTKFYGILYTLFTSIQIQHKQKSLKSAFIWRHLNIMVHKQKSLKSIYMMAQSPTRNLSGYALHTESRWQFPNYWDKTVEPCHLTKQTKLLPLIKCANVLRSNP